MKITISNDITISGANEEAVHYCREKLILDNPDYYKKEHLGKWTGGTPRDLYLYTLESGDYHLPFGCLKDIWRLYPDKMAYKVDICPVRAFSYESGINLYDYQEKAVEAALRAKNGVLVMPCGSGKTQCGIETIARIGGRALWLTHTHDLLMQSKKRAESVLGEVGVGTITGGKVVLGEGITFSTVQTLCKVDLEKYKDYWDVIVVDECQHCAGSPTRVTQFYKVLTSLSARYKYGLTATPKRADGLERAMFAILGDVIYEVTREDVKHTTCPVKVDVRHTGWVPDYDAILNGDGTIDFPKVIDDLTHNEDRYNVVFGDIVLLSGAIVLANRVEYLQRMCDDAKGCGKRAVCLSGAGQSKRAKAERKEALEKLNNGELDMIFATYQLAKEGLDVPSLRYVVFATPEKDETTVIQSVGRVGRKAEGKTHGTVIDYVDDDFGMFRSWAKKRVRYYKKIEAEVI